MVTDDAEWVLRCSGDGSMKIGVLLWIVACDSAEVIIGAGCLTILVVSLVDAPL